MQARKLLQSHWGHVHQPAHCGDHEGRLQHHGRQDGREHQHSKHSTRDWHCAGSAPASTSMRRARAAGPARPPAQGHTLTRGFIWWGVRACGSAPGSILRGRARGTPQPGSGRELGVKVRRQRTSQHIAKASTGDRPSAATSTAAHRQASSASAVANESAQDASAAPRSSADAMSSCRPHGHCYTSEMQHRS